MKSAVITLNGDGRWEGSILQVQVNDRDTTMLYVISLDLPSISRSVTLIDYETSQRRMFKSCPQKQRPTPTYFAP